MQITRNSTDCIVENKLPDGSRLLVDSRNDRVIALNATAGAAWDACAAPTTIDGIAQSMRRALGPELPDELVQEAIGQLQEKSLVTSAALLQSASRRAFMAKVGAAAVPLVVAMTMGEQRAYAHCTGSGSSFIGNHHHDHPQPPFGGDGGQNSGGNGCDGFGLFNQDCGGNPKQNPGWWW